MAFPYRVYLKGKVGHVRKSNISRWENDGCISLGSSVEQNRGRRQERQRDLYEMVTVLVWVLQRTEGWGVMRKQESIYYEELAPTIMEDLQLAES